MKNLLLGGAAAVLLLVTTGCDKQPAGASNAPGGSEKIRIGFLVKQPEEPWFQTEWAFAQKAADENGFELIKIATPDGEKALAAIDNLAALGAKGFVICTPDVRLGPALAAKAQMAGMKFMTVDDQFVGPDGKIMADVPHLGMSPWDIGHQAGTLELAEMKKRGWKPEETAACVSSFDELDTAKQRTDGATAALIAGGFPKDRIFQAPNKTTDLPGSFDAVNVCLTQHPEVKHWLIVGMNDNAVLGGVRATEGRGFSPADVIGIGINGTDCQSEFQKPAQTGFYGSLLLSPNRHGKETAMLVYRWVKDGVEPPKETYIKSATLITRDNWQDELRKQGMLQ
ncbi:MAG TPA: arabinose ABC transporter substrate-binding protein [Chthoniobacterales bacterium]|jgi:L-arabinose transport system substrate-binding protein